MAEIKAFRGLRYNLSKVDLQEVTTPPYDIISPPQQEEYYQRSPFNMIRLDLGKTYPSDNADDNRYTRAAADFSAWQESGILLKDAEPRLYVYRQSWRDNDCSREVTGIVCLVKLEELGSGILPHEKTLSKPKADRRALLEACHANFSQVFSLYWNGDTNVKGILSETAAGAAEDEATDKDGVRHQLWSISEGDRIQTISGALTGKRLLIADGHHRYETSLNFAKDMRAGGARDEGLGYIMMYLVDMATEDLVILPTHRLVKLAGFDPDLFLERLAPLFEIEPLDSTAAPAVDQAEVTFGVYARGRHLRLRAERRRLADLIEGPQAPEWKSLDTALLQETVLRPVLGIDSGDSRLSFTQDADYAIEAVDNGQADLALFVQPTDMAQVAAAAEVGEKMPQKSTYFYPKPLTGLVLNKLD
jgi:uncharacterized protein (DUF1015 family)